MPKTREGYYHYTGGVEAAIKRELAFAPYADMIWLETKLPDLQQARYFSRKIRDKYPGKYVFSQFELPWKRDIDIVCAPDGSYTT